MPFNAYTVPANTVQNTRVDMDENDTLTVESAGRLSVGANAQSVRFVAPTAGAVITNDGTIENTNASGRAIRFETAVGPTLIATIDNGPADTTATITSIDDAIQIQARAFTGGQLSIANGGLIRSTSGQALDFGGATGALGISITNKAGGQLIGDVSEAIRIGTTGAVVVNAGTIAGGNNAGYSTSVDGIQFEDNASGTVTNNAGGTISGDRHGIDAGVGSTVNVINAAGGTITGRNGSGVGSDGSGSVTNYGTITGSVTINVATDANGPGAPGVPDGVPDGDGDGVDMDGTLSLLNFGRIQGLGASGTGGDGLQNTSDGVAAGGGTIDNRAGAVIVSTDRGILIDNGSQGNSFAQTNILNAGLIEGTGGIGIRLVSTFDDTITNSGTITGGNGTAVLFGEGNNTLKLAATSVINGLTNGEGGVDTLDYSAWGAAGINVDLTNGTASGTGGILNFENVLGSAGADRLVGNGSNNVLSGGAGNDTIFGGSGNDVLTGGTGNDLLTGGTGADRFVFRAGDGNDTINDFSVAEGDRLDFGGRAYSFRQDTSGTVIEFANGDRITLSGVKNYDPASASGGKLVGESDTFRFFDTKDGGHFYTASVAERDQVIATRPDLVFEGLSFKSLNDASLTGASPVFRFFDTKDGSHFYTISTAERDQVLATRSDLKLEGTAFFEFSSSQGNNSTAVFRFFDTKDGDHFYTASEAERDNVLATRPDLAFEGVAFYAPQDSVAFVV